MVEYQVKLEGSILQNLGFYPHMHLYALLLVIADLKRQGKERDVEQRTLNDKAYRRGISEQVKAKLAEIQSSEKHLFDTTIDKVDGNGIACICSVDGIAPEKRSAHFASRLGSNAVVVLHPGTAVLNGIWLKMERITEFVQVTLRSGTSIMIALRDDIRITRNGREIGCKPYIKEEVASLIEKFTTAYSFNVEDIMQGNSSDMVRRMVTAMWSMKPNSSMNYLEEKMWELMKVLGKLYCDDNGVEWNGYFDDGIEGQTGLLQRSMVMILDAWVAYLSLKLESGIDGQYVKSLPSWIDMMHAQWKAHGYSPYVDDSIRIHNEDNMVVEHKMRQWLDEYAVDVACNDGTQEYTLAAFMLLAYEYNKWMRDIAYNIFNQ